MNQGYCEKLITT